MNDIGRVGVKDQMGEVISCLGSLNSHEDCQNVADAKQGKNVWELMEIFPNVGQHRMQ